MALTFGAATTNVVNCGSATVLDNLTTATVLLWTKVTTLTDARQLITKRTTGSPFAGWALYLSGTAGNVIWFWERPTNMHYVTNDTPLSSAVWKFLAATFDSGATPSAHIYSGGLSTLAAENTYGTAINGSGTPVADAAVSLGLGNRVGGSISLQGQIAVAAIFSRVLTLGEIRSWQFNPRMMAGCIGLWHLGFNGTGTQRDHSGNFNAGTVTGATVALHVPLRAPFGIGRAWRGAFTAPAAAVAPRAIFALVNA